AHPDDPWFAAQLVTALGASGQSAEAFARADAFRASAGDHPALALAEATVAGAIQDYNRQRTAAARAAERAHVLAATTVEADAPSAIATAAASLGDYYGAFEQLRRARSLYLADDHLASAATLCATEANMLYMLGKVRDARAIMDRAVAIARKPGFD